LVPLYFSSGRPRTNAQRQAEAVESDGGPPCLLTRTTRRHFSSSCNSTEARWISESDPWKQAVIPHSYPKSTARQHDSMGQGTDLLCGEIGLWIHERVLIQPLPNDPTEFAMTQGRKRLVATTEGERDEGRRQGNGTSECFSVHSLTSQPRSTPSIPRCCHPFQDAVKDSHRATVATDVCQVTEGTGDTIRRPAASHSAPSHCR